VAKSHPLQTSTLKSPNPVPSTPTAQALVVGLVARQIRGVYVLTSLGKAEIDPFRNVVIQALIARATLRKGDVLDAAKLALKCDVPQTVYTRVLKELCMSRGGVWVLRSGDGS
jgi:DNA-directed RNA polymerase-3 subunit RPC5